MSPRSDRPLDTIVLRGLVFRSHIGVEPFEKRDGQTLVIDVALHTLTPLRAVETDRLDDTVSYAAVFETVRSVVEPSRVDLIERLAGAIAERVLAMHDVDIVDVTVNKPDAPIDGRFQTMAVSISRARPWRRAYLGLGSNVGNRRAHLRSALDALGRTSGITLIAVSKLYETEPWGKTDQPAFLNAVVAIDTALAAGRLLDVAQAIEDQAGRVRTERWGPRTLDIDLLTVDGETRTSPRLTLPHPLMNERPFVRIPLADVMGTTAPSDPSVSLKAKSWYSGCACADEAFVSDTSEEEDT